MMYVAKLSAASSSRPKIGTPKISNVAWPASCKVTQRNLPDCCIVRRDPGGSSFLWQGVQYVLQKLVTDRHGRFEIYSLVVGIYRSTFCRFDDQLLGEPKRT